MFLLYAHETFAIHRGMSENDTVLKTPEKQNLLISSLPF